MRFRHRDGESAPGAISLGPVRDTVRTDENGEFEVDDDRDDLEDVVERLVKAGHEPLDDLDDDADDQEGDDDADDQEGDDDADDQETVEETEQEEDGEDSPPPLTEFSEEDLVSLTRNELRPLAAQYGHINGNASADELLEELIKQLRAEQDQEAE